MPIKRAWTEDDIARLKTMAGKEPGVRIAQKLGRTLGAVAVEASKLGLSLRTRRGGQSSEQVRVEQREAPPASK